MAGKNTLLALSLAFASCEYHTPPALSVPMAEASPGVVPDNRDARPTVRFPARIAIARIAASGDGFKLEDSTTGEKPEHAAKVASLPGVAGVMALNRIALISHVESYRELDGEAFKLGADILAVYRFDSSEDIQDVSVPLTVASLGLAPNHTHKTTTVATLMIRDARTGYIYGILEERGSSSGLTAGIDVSNASHRGARRSRAEAMDKLMEQVPGFWNGVLAKGR